MPEPDKKKGKRSIASRIWGTKAHKNYKFEEEQRKLGREYHEWWPDYGYQYMHSKKLSGWYTPEEWREMWKAEGERKERELNESRHYREKNAIIIGRERVKREELEKNRKVAECRKIIAEADAEAEGAPDNNHRSEAAPSNIPPSNTHEERMKNFEGFKKENFNDKNYIHENDEKKGGYRRKPSTKRNRKTKGSKKSTAKRRKYL
jgi:hypothetical protein